MQTRLLPSTAQRRYPLRYWLLVAYCVCMPNFVKFDASGKTHEFGLFNPTSLSVIALTLLTASLLIIMTLLNRQKLLQRPIHLGGWMWLALFANFVVSTILSPAAKLTPSKMTDLPLCLFRMGEWVLIFALLLSVYSREDEQSSTDLSIRVIASACWINIAMVWFFLPILPSLVYGVTDDLSKDHARLGGALIHPVHLSVLAGIAFFHALFFLRGALRYAGCALAFVTLMMTYARSEQLLFLVALFSYLIIFSRKPLLRWMGLLSIIAVFALAGAFYERVLKYLARGQGVRNITTLSERTDVWKASFIAFKDRPWIGYGFIIGVKNALKDHWTATNWIPPHSHSEFIQALVTGGVFAGLLIVAIYVRVLWSAVRQAGRDQQHTFLLIALIQVIGMACIMPLTTVARGEIGSVFVVLYVGVVAGAPLKKRVPQASRSRYRVLQTPQFTTPATLRWRTRSQPVQDL